MKKNLISKFVLVFCVFLFVSCKEKKSVLSFEAMNTFMVVQGYGSSANKTNLLIKQKMLELDDLLSTTKENSEVYAINHAEGKKVFIHEQTSELLDFALSMLKKTDGALNPFLYPVVRSWGFTTEEYRIPSDEELKNLLLLTKPKIIKKEQNSVQISPDSQIDFGAIGKGYAGDLAIDLYKKNGVKSALIDLGGNIQVLGTKIDGTEWTVGIKNPFSTGAVASVKVHDCAVITSGGYERFFTGEDGNRYIHIFDANTGKPVQNGTESVTVIAKSGLYADSLSTALFVMGLEKATLFWKENQDFDMIFITEEKNLYYTKGLEEKIKVFDGLSSVFVIENS